MKLIAEFTFVFGFAVLLPVQALPKKFSNTFKPVPCPVFDGVLPLVEELSNLENKGPLTCAFLDQNQFLDKVAELLKKDTILDRLPIEEKILQRLGIIPETYPYAKCIFENIGSSAAAFYTPYDHRTYLPSWFNVPRKLLVHEITHALQDQHFDTVRLGTSKFLFSDNIFATASLLEGHAMYVERAYKRRFPESIGKEDVSPSTSPPPRVRGCRAPESLEQFTRDLYIIGEEFLVQQLETDPKFTLDYLFFNPPLYSAEILFPKLYKERKFLNLKLPVLPTELLIDGESAKALFSDSLGVYGASMVFANFKKLELFSQIASSWNGDRFAFYAKTESLDKGLLLWKSKWTEYENAKKFATLCVHAFAGKARISIQGEEVSLVLEI